MNVETTPLAGLLVIEPKVFGDARGFFMESWKRAAFDAAVGAPVDFVQDNHSRSARGVLRGLHWQRAPHAQGKLVRVVQGRVFDVTVDLRRTSASFGRWFGCELSGENHRQLWIPAGFAHGFLVLSDSADFLYKITAPYVPAAESCLRWDDPSIGIAWPDAGIAPQVSAKDAAGLALADAPTFD